MDPVYPPPFASITMTFDIFSGNGDALNAFDLTEFPSLGATGTSKNNGTPPKPNYGKNLR